MLHVWLLPLLAILGLVLLGFYLLICFAGGSGIRTEGRTMVDKADDEDQPPVL